ncbi:hypothetical protein TanjilG_07971 [Lupinus angustifolius]|uniref:PUM-HD domain-containing protein n=1 Tax=Lupinus angustifolius TaxID=3871 RepID=A0A4P1RM22_LUPAN|nr:PREDICTED: putative pumilio homolog 7, chloroplastic [Lupinus angustifolius]OIW13629.1 hypothetical protein TanjilG_07971 [Lupinus angustifolius]
MGGKMRENVNDDWEVDEFQMLLDEEIPLATSSHINNNHNLLHHAHVGDDHSHVYGNGVIYYDDDPFKYPYTSSPVSAFSLQSFGGSSSSLFSGMHSSSDTGSPTPLTLPFEDFQSSVPSVRDKVNDSLVDELGLAANFSKMYIANQQQNPNGLSFPVSGNNPISVHNKHGDYDNFKREFFSSGGFEPPFLMSHRAEMNSALSGPGQDYKMDNLFRSQTFPGWHETMLSQLNSFSGSMDPPRHMRQLINDDYCRGSLATEFAATMSRNPVVDVSLYGQKYGMNLIEERGMPRLPYYSLCTNLRPYTSVPDSLHYGFPLCNARAVPPSNARITQGSLDIITREGSFILQGESLNYVARCRGSDQSRYWNAVGETGLDIMLPKYNLNSLAEARGCIYLIAKDQYGCRFLQRMFDEGTPEDVQVIFNEIIDHVVELMVNPFGNYLMQKLLDVCSEEQRMQIILMVTGEIGQLVRISLNTHGTRVVQKLIETLKTWQQISLVVSALEPGFLTLIKDLNGNHVVQHCLQCLSNEDNKFIFAAAAKYCVDIATHQHGCCVLQRCIGHSNGEHREKLVAEICANALLLAQDQFGNYVVQFVLDLRNPSATANVISQFKGNYVHLSMQKFGSHVVEKCLAVFNDENCSRVIFELLSAPCFGQLLQDPHANYVVQSALRHSEGHAHNSLVEAVESHKTMSRNNPYSRKIFSQKLLKK